MSTSEPQVLLTEMEEISGEDELKKISEMLHGGGAAGRSSFRKTLFRRKGSVIIKVIPVSILGGFLAFLLVAISSQQPDLVFLPVLKHPFAVQILSIILSFVIVARSNIAMDRYFGGCACVHTMSTRWIDGFTSLLGFCRSSADMHPKGSPKEEATVALSYAMLHWGSLAHALAINSLQITQLGMDEAIWEHRIQPLNPPETISSVEAPDGEKSLTVGHLNSSKSRSKITGAAMSAEKEVVLGSNGQVESKRTGTQRQLAKLGIYGEPSHEEMQRLHGATDKVAICLMWMEEAVSRAQIQGILLTAPPILGRVYGELGCGLAAFNNAYRLALVPFPFCFAQMIGWCLFIFLFICPAVSYVFTGGEALTSSLTFCSMMGFWGLNRIAIELESPFGTEVNHLPLAEMHFAYIEALGEMHKHPMPEYQWESHGDAEPPPMMKRNLLA